MIMKFACKLLSLILVIGGAVVAPAPADASLPAPPRRTWERPAQCWKHPERKAKCIRWVPVPRRP